MSRRVGVVLVALSLAACSSGGDDDDGGGGAGGDGIAGHLASLPARSGNDPSTVAFGDLATAAELADVDLTELEIPSSGDADAMQPLLQAVNAMTGGPVDESESSSVAAVTPDAAHVERLVELAAFVEEVGWSVLDVDRFVEYQVPPNVVTVMEGRFDEDRLNEALGEPDDGVWVVGDPDGDLSLNDVSAARPIGEALWLSLVDDDRLVVTRTAEDMEAVRSGEGESLADEDALTTLAEALDGEDVYSAVLHDGPMGADLGRVTPEQVEAMCEEALPEPVVAVGTGITDDDGPVMVLAHLHADGDAAEANAEALEALVAGGASMRTREPWSETLEVDSVEADGNVTVARLRLVEPSRAGLWRRILLERDNLVSSC